MYRYEAIPTGLAGFKQNIALVRRATTESFQQLSCFGEGPGLGVFGQIFQIRHGRRFPFLWDGTADPKWPLPRRQHRFYARIGLFVPAH